jgi:hypothetical protein
MSLAFNISDFSQNGIVDLSNLHIPITVTITRPIGSEPIDEDALRAALDENLRVGITPDFEIASSRSITLGCSGFGSSARVSPYKKMCDLYEFQDKVEMNTETCSVCLDSNSTVETNCHHSFCSSCINQWTMK